MDNTAGPRSVAPVGASLIHRKKRGRSSYAVSVLPSFSLRVVCEASAGGADGE